MLARPEPPSRIAACRVPAERLHVTATTVERWVLKAQAIERQTFELPQVEGEVGIPPLGVPAASRAAVGDAVGDDEPTREEERLREENAWLARRNTLLCTRFVSIAQELKILADMAGGSSDPRWRR